jgi:hypothetical protein
MGGSRTAVALPHPARRQFFGGPVPKSAKPPTISPLPMLPNPVGGLEGWARCYEQPKGSETELVGNGPAQAAAAPFAAAVVSAIVKMQAVQTLEFDQDVGVHDLLPVRSQNL